jgi:hypothetical protein
MLNIRNISTIVAMFLIVCHFSQSELLFWKKNNKEMIWKCDTRNWFRPTSNEDVKKSQ